ncbi:nucleoside phosphorylase domain-containing protein [Aspergillus caelatus]|uniref:Nucleoside phosphorylase domain-containing protein n=1 Tax=Aspergillus caelatus TaxID=61420 RepID=A0A5N6ZNB2_9EURO|nr:nucleoside phosphorylase domain-containing protein [Aspergillus caelatus]KAE8358693.1 nucleoside phosphorylase domain-containing protein [Aspergillus caelatus]
MSGPTRYSRYTVGWICAIHKEYVAAKAFLDEEHDRPQTVAPNDINAYTLGKIGEHNVVISALPDGEYGTSAAAIVATNLVRTFHNVRIGFMVGIGGGVPSAECDIRLGDVVVGSPSGGHTGVFQYDFGKAVQGQGFQYTGSMNLPPQAVRTHITDLRAQYDLHGSNLDASINAALDRFPRLRNGYKRPCPGQDRLYQSWVVHGETCCQGLDEHDESKLILRNPRTKENDNPAIHYGLIASGNQLMKDATLRDAMSREHKVLCFEMEAAGMVNSFPCLVVRGICDYADSHKNDRWQGYSAMAAAAFAKDLLKQIPVEVVNEEKAIADILSDGQSRPSEYLRSRSNNK